jgi:glycosyltransferase involved in cell wall biosynthesis
MKIDINIFVPIFNHENIIQKCLESILNQKTRYTYKIICLDDYNKNTSPLFYLNCDQRDCQK